MVHGPLALLSSLPKIQETCDVGGSSEDERDSAEQCRNGSRRGRSTAPPFIHPTPTRMAQPHAVRVGVAMLGTRANNVLRAACAFRNRAVSVIARRQTLTLVVSIVPQVAVSLVEAQPAEKRKTTHDDWKKGGAKKPRKCPQVCIPASRGTHASGAHTFAQVRSHYTRAQTLTHPCARRPADGHRLRARFEHTRCASDAGGRMCVCVRLCVRASVGQRLTDVDVGCMSV